MDLSVCVILLLVHRVCGLILLDPPDLRGVDLQKALFPVEAEVEADEILTEFADLARLGAELGRPGEWSAPEHVTTPNQGSMVTSLEPADFLWPESSPGLDDTADDPEDQLEEDVENTARMLSSLHRTRRAAPGRIDAKVEVLVVVDNSIYRWFLVKFRNNAKKALDSIRLYFAIIFAMVDQRYQTIPDRNLNIGVKISGILVAETRQDAAWLEYQVSWTGRHSVPGSVNANRALAKLQRWLSSQTSSLPKHDHAMAFTRYALVNKFDIELGGLAYVSSICLDDEQSISIVADSGDYQSVKVATHELGHSLGAFHDGDDKNRHCPPNDNYIMAPQNSHAHNKLKNAFYFSVCSIEQMRKTLGSPKGSCVLDTPNVIYPYNLELRPPGQLYSAKLQCKMVFGKKSGVCKKRKLRKMMCSQLWCKDPENGYTCRTNSHLTALPGTTCGNGKTCHLGECRADPFTRARSGQSRRNRARAGRKGRRRRNRHQRQQQQQQRQRQRQQQQRQQQQRQRGTRHRQPRPQQQQQRQQLQRQQQQRQQQQRQRAEPCAGDRNSEYCQGLTRLNPRACQRSAVGTYCCHTCARIRR